MTPRAARWVAAPAAFAGEIVLAACAYLVAHALAGGGMPGVAAGVAAVVAWVGAWAVWMTPRSSRRVPRAARIAAVAVAGLALAAVLLAAGSWWTAGLAVLGAAAYVVAASVDATG